MKILYMQRNDENSDLSKISILEGCGITSCFLRYANSENHFSTLSPRMHQHTFNELHLVLEGSQQYQILNSVYTVPSGHFLLIPADLPHQHLFTAPNTRKYTISFSPAKNATSGLAAFFEKKLICKAATEDALNALRNIESEADAMLEYSIALIESKLFLFLLYLARDAGISEGSRAISTEEDPRLRLARQFIADNLDHAVSCSEVANYCHLSQKQLSRLFDRFLGTSIADYIRSQRIIRIKRLLTDSSDSLEQISEKMHFSNVYHFNTFFAKYAGIAPGRFRKMHNTNQ